MSRALWLYVGCGDMASIATFQSLIDGAGSREGNFDQKDQDMIEPGNNIAIKVPLYKWAETVSFYRDRVGLEVIKEQPNSIAFSFGSMTLWIDKVEHQSQVDVWLELFSDDPEEALATLGSPKRDEVEPLDNVNGHWTCDPAGTILLVHTNDS